MTARRRCGVVTAVAIVGVAAAVQVGGGCGGGDPYCGDGTMDPGEQCDDGNDDELDFCRACVVYSPPRTTVKWGLNDDPSRGFAGDACIDLGVSMVRVELAGPEAPVMDARCTDSQVVFQELTFGDYTVSVTPFDAGGIAMVTAPVTAPLTVAGTGEILVIIPFTAWNRPYTGTFQFRLTWGGQTCTAALPPVLTQVLTLLIGGTPVTQLTDTGQRLDGTDPDPCRASTEQHRVLALPLGPATLIVEGRDSTGAAQYNQTFETFVGAGPGNPTYDFDVPGPDAAPPDAAPPDAALPDAST